MTRRPVVPPRAQKLNPIPWDLFGGRGGRLVVQGRPCAGHWLTEACTSTDVTDAASCASNDASWLNFGPCDIGCTIELQFCLVRAHVTGRGEDGE
jgi:hypothetical protein